MNSGTLAECISSSTIRILLHFVFIEYEDVAEPDTDPEGNKHGNYEENDTTNSMFKMPEILKIKGKVVRSQLTALNP